ncbi:hypothetical protein D3C85_1778830 [compost metagenome]
MVPVLIVRDDGRALIEAGVRGERRLVGGRIDIQNSGQGVGEVGHQTRPEPLRFRLAIHDLD